MRPNLREILKDIKRTRIDADQFAIDAHLSIIEKYGWIPPDEYAKIPIPMINNMIARMQREHEQMEKNKKKR